MPVHLNPVDKERVYALAAKLEVQGVSTMDLALWPIGFLEVLVKRIEELETKVQDLESRQADPR